MYTNARSHVKVNGTLSEEIVVKVHYATCSIVT